MIKNKRLKLACVGLMLVAMLSSVSSSLAWLSAASEPVVNYFSGGTIAIKLDEVPVDTSGKEISGDRVQENHYKYVAGATLDKDPTVTVLANSEECYVYVCVDNELPSSLFTLDTNTAAWTYVSSAGNMTIYRYSTVVESSTSDQALVPVFTQVSISADLTAEDIEDLGTKTLTVTSFAIQTASLDTDTADSLAASYFFDGVDLTAIEAETPEPTATEEPEATTEATSTPSETASTGTDSEADATATPVEATNSSDNGETSTDNEETEATAVPSDAETDGEVNKASTDTEAETENDSSTTEDNSNAETEAIDDGESDA